MGTAVGTVVGEPALTLRLFGPPALRRDGQAVALPPSRKVRALLAYLALAGHGVSRSRLCELLWDLPSDPRGELRWTLSKLRGLLDAPSRPCVVTTGDSVAVDLAEGAVDAVQVQRAVQQGIATTSADGLEALAGLLAGGEFLEGLDLPRSPAFTGWQLAQRRRFRAAEAAVLEHWVQALPADDPRALPALERWTTIAPFDKRAHQGLLQALAVGGRLHEGEAHLAATARRYEAEGLDWAPIGHAWRAARQGRPAAAIAAGATRPALNEPITDPAVATAPAAARRASLAVMPFTDLSPGAGLRGGMGDGLAHDVISRLAKLRSLFVIAQGSVFALDERRVDPHDAGRRLDVDYLASGSLRRDADGRLRVMVQLTDARSARVLWADEFQGQRDDTLALLDEVGNRIVSALSQQVEMAERNRAVLKPPGSLDAWEAHHRGLWHMLRFNREDNEQARHFFETALRLDPTFGRPYAGLSFTHFQDAFLGWAEHRGAAEQAYRIASQGLMVDEHDPAAHWALGRAMWLQGRPGDGLTELQAAVHLSPNFALGHYTLGFVQSQSGDPQAAIGAVDLARALSPFDPLLFGMLASRALALLRLDRAEEAANWALQAAARPNAHAHIQAIALGCLRLAGRQAEAQSVADALKRDWPAYGLEDLLRAFRLPPPLQDLLRRALAA
ncbi:transcriptional regulator [Aquabacterium sp. J223]|uniref:transcriptional regulator n=1 Tax=Aquabacterium sp. J223 TaxID=2898431 RepID=UPI0021AD7155|nr:transcriptional regulator [Aquabacterium sp. J223]UUX96298.1 transcriptional regulator [Aquabacterium sp. J223]